MVNPTDNAQNDKVLIMQDRRTNAPRTKWCNRLITRFYSNQTSLKDFEMAKTRLKAAFFASLLFVFLTASSADINSEATRREAITHSPRLIPFQENKFINLIGKI